MSKKKIDKVLVLRTCAPDMTAHGGFKWPTSGKVSAPDWQDDGECGHGLHGLLLGEGDGALLNWDEHAKWLVVEVNKADIRELNWKVKFPEGKVVFCGDRLGATSYLAERSSGHAVVGGTATAGDAGTATAGYEGTATAGYRGILNIRWWDGKRYRIATFYVGEDGIEPNIPYCCEDGKAVKKV